MHNTMRASIYCLLLTFGYASAVKKRKKNYSEWRYPSYEQKIAALEIAVPEKYKEIKTIVVCAHAVLSVENWLSSVNAHASLSDVKAREACYLKLITIYRDKVQKYKPLDGLLNATQYAPFVVHVAHNMIMPMEKTIEDSRYFMGTINGTASFKRWACNSARCVLRELIKHPAIEAGDLKNHIESLRAVRLRANKKRIASTDILAVEYAQRDYDVSQEIRNFAANERICMALGAQAQILEQFSDLILVPCMTVQHKNNILDLMAHTMHRLQQLDYATDDWHKTVLRSAHGVGTLCIRMCAINKETGVSNGASMSIKKFIETIEAVGSAVATLHDRDAHQIEALISTEKFSDTPRIGATKDEWNTWTFNQLRIK